MDHLIDLTQELRVHEIRDWTCFNEEFNGEEQMPRLNLIRDDITNWTRMTLEPGVSQITWELRVWREIERLS